MFGLWIKKNQKPLQIKDALITAEVANLGPILVSQPSSSYPHASHIEASEKDKASKTWYWVSCIEVVASLHSQLSCMPEKGV